MTIEEFRKTLKELFILSFPILAGNIGQMLINLGDVYVAGHYSTEVLAAVSIGSAIFMTYIVTGFGLTSAITPVLSNYRGQNIQSKKFFNSTVIFSQIISIILFAFIWLMIPLTEKFNLSCEVQSDTILYLKISSFSVFFIFLFQALREFLQSYEIVKLPNIMLIVSVIFNIILNFLFVFGYGIFPELKTAGLALASLIVRMALSIILFAFCAHFAKNHKSPNISSYIKDLIKVGLPISGAMFIEFFGFNIVAVLVGKFAPVYPACHNIIISIVSLCYMIPFSISCALSVKIGYANGCKNLKEIKRYLLYALVFAVCYSFICVLIYLLFNKQLMQIFSNDTEVIKIGSNIMILAACFTTFDAIQSVCMGALKGIKKTVEVLIVDFLAYAVISIPLGIYLAYKKNLMLEGFWMGLAFGIFMAALAALFLFIKNYFKLKKIY